MNPRATFSCFSYTYRKKYEEKSEESCLRKATITDSIPKGINEKKKKTEEREGPTNGFSTSYILKKKKERHTYKVQFIG